MDRRNFLWNSLAAGSALLIHGARSSFPNFLSHADADSMIDRKNSTTNTKEASFYNKLEKGKIRCTTCFRQCIVKPGRKGFCRVRLNVGGKYYLMVYGRPSAVQVEPIEKEPQLHMLPGSEILCLGTVGCNFRCRHCHNWHLSQANLGDLKTYELAPEDVITLALSKNIPTISFTYNEPTIFYEYMYDVAVMAKAKGLRILFHSNGAIKTEPLKKLLKYTDAVTIDLKGFTDKAYNNSSARLEPTLETLKTVKQSGVWLEIVNLVIPSINDEQEDIKQMCEWIKTNIGVDTPLRFSRFFPDYKLTHLPLTPISTLEKAHQIAFDVGLHYVTLGNVPMHKFNSTFCPKCRNCIIERRHFLVLSKNVVNGKCKYCNHTIPGIWN